MILKGVDFTDFYKHISDIFSQHFTKKQTTELMTHVNILSDANFKCYRANMIVIETRKTDSANYKLIADMEWAARSVGEYRVSSKARINKFISRAKTVKDIVHLETWMSDDIVYGIGEMMDRLSIEIIKREDFFKNNRPVHMTDSSKKLSDRVEKYLKAKLEEIDKKRFYECVHEQRTYDLEGIIEELAL